MLSLILLLLAPGSHAATEVEVLVKHSYSENRTRLYQQGKSWQCDTELQKEVPLKGKALSPSLFPRKEKNKKSGCESQAMAVILENGKARKWQGCDNDPDFRPFLQALNKECGR